MPNHHNKQILDEVHSRGECPRHAGVKNINNHELTFCAELKKTQELLKLTTLTEIDRKRYLAIEMFIENEILKLNVRKREIIQMCENYELIL